MPETKQYGIIYADPPWRYDRKHGSGVAENHYPTMSIEEICALPVSELAAKDSALFLWATFPQLNEAFRPQQDLRRNRFTDDTSNVRSPLTPTKENKKRTVTEIVVFRVICSICHTRFTMHRHKGAKAAS